jgi:hypothetical protein
LGRVPVSTKKATFSRSGMLVLIAQMFGLSAHLPSIFGKYYSFSPFICGYRFFKAGFSTQGINFVEIVQTFGRFVLTLLDCLILYSGELIIEIPEQL